MPVIENIKNFIRHGKNARQTHEPSPSASHTVSDPPPRTAAQGRTEKHQQPIVEHDEDNHVVPEHVSPHGGITAAGINKATGKGYDQETLAKLVAEEKANREKLPRYPGLERWALLSKMGDGAFSNVYRARDMQGVYGEVAIKVVRKFELNASQGDEHIHPDVKKGNKVVERANILKEVSIMKRLDHPNIVKLIDFKEAKAYYYLILELCPGGELFHQIVRLTYFSEDLSRHVIVQVAEALRYLHEEKGVVHRDIKPENLLFYPTQFVPTKNPKPRNPDDEQKEDEGEFIPGVGSGGIGKIKIADFGLSKVIWEDTTVTPCGTVGYTAPEIVKDERYSKSVDMWALGCVLYTLLCGFPPFYDESISVLTEKVARGQYTFLSPWWDDISKSAQDLVSHLLTVEPDKRYTIEQFMNHPWIKNSAEPTNAAEDAPPLATPAAVKKERSSMMDIDSPMMGETPGGRRMDFRSPGAVSLREVFDVGYAVHRMEEENKRRKNWKHGYQDLNEEDEESTSGESDNEVNSSKTHRDGGADDVADTLRRTNLNPAPAPPSSVYSSQVANARAPPTAAAKKATAAKANEKATRAGVHAASKKRNPGFELTLDNATLIGRRKRIGGDHIEPTPIAG